MDRRPEFVPLGSFVTPQPPLWRRRVTDGAPRIFGGRSSARKGMFAGWHEEAPHVPSIRTVHLGDLRAVGGRLHAARLGRYRHGRQQRHVGRSRHQRPGRNQWRVGRRGVRAGRKLRDGGNLGSGRHDGRRRGRQRRPSGSRGGRRFGHRRRIDRRLQRDLVPERLLRRQRQLRQPRHGGGLRHPGRRLYRLRDRPGLRERCLYLRRHLLHHRLLQRRRTVHHPHPGRLRQERRALRGVQDRTDLRRHWGLRLQRELVPGRLLRLGRQLRGLCQPGGRRLRRGRRRLPALRQRTGLRQRRRLHLYDGVVPERLL